MRVEVAQAIPLDQLWPLISNMFVPKKRGRPRIHSPKRIIEAILYVAKTGCQWFMLPSNFPPYKTVYHYFRSWTENGTWEVICEKIRARVRTKSGKYRYSRGVSIDSQSVRTFFGQGAVGYDGHKKVKGRKRHLMVDSLGLLICVICMAANLHDIKAGRMMMNRLKNEARLERVRFLNVDGAYVSLKDPDDKIAIQVSSLPKGSGFQPFPQRWKVERSISWSRGYRRLTMDFEKKTRYSEAWNYIAFILIGLKKLKKLD